MRIALLILLICKISTSYTQICDNVDFENGNTDGWEGFTGFIDRGGKVRIDKPGMIQGRHMITQGLDMDEVAAECGINIPKVEESGVYSFRLGNNETGAQAESIRRTFVVEPGQEFFLYKYAVILEDPQHRPHEQPRFEVRIFDEDGNAAPCGEFKVRAGPNAANEGFKKCLGKSNGFFRRTYWVKDWTVAGADLSDFIGKKVTIEFMTSDCSKRGHAGYAYVEASCRNLDIAIDGFCANTDNVTLSVTQGWKEYKWFNGATTNSTTVTGLQLGDTVSVELTSFSGCSTIIKKAVGPSSQVALYPVDDISVCEGERAVLRASGENVGSFKWFPTGEVGQEIVITGGDTTSYVVEAFDLNGCSTGLTDTVEVSIRGFDVELIKNNVTCAGLPNGSASLNITGGIAPFTYLWSTGDSLATVDNLIAGDYNVLVTDNNGNGCTKSIDFTIEQPPQSNISINTGSSPAFCELPNGNAWIEVTNGLPPYTFFWEHDGSTNDTIYNVVAGTYRVIVTEENGIGCEHVLDIEVLEGPFSTLIEGTDNSCNFVDGAAELSVFGGSGSHDILWSNGATGYRIEDLNADMYYVTVTDTNGCVLTDSVEILPPPSPVNATLNKIDPICSPSDGSITAEPTDGISPYSYQWSNGATTQTITNLTEGLYSVKVFDANGCSYETNITLLPPPPPFTAQVVASPLKCTPNDGSAEVFLQNGNGPFSYSWNVGAANTEKIDSLSLGYYEVTVTDANGCTAVAADSITTLPTIIEATVETEKESYDLANGSATIDVINGIGPFDLTWNPSGQKGSRVENLTDGLYFVTITDSKGCKREIEVIIEEKERIIIPNAFTPNGDGVNETWQIQHIELYPGSKVVIFNRWGKQLFESNGYELPWSGIDGNNYFPADTYYYSIDLGIGLKKPFTGFVDIIK